MPNLDLPIQGYDDPIVGNNDYALPVAQPIPQNIPRVYVDSPGIENRQEQQPILKPVDYNPFEKLLGLNGAERYKTWPEKLITSGITAAGDALSGKIPQYEVDPVSGDVHTSPQMLERALDMASMAGTGGLAGTTDATLGSAPFLRPALKYKDKLYKGKEGQQHMDVIPEALYPEFQKMAMSGEDISHYNFGFHNDKGQFLSREKALEYGINTGLIDPQAGKFGALTSTLMADSSKPGVAIEAVAKAEPFFSALEHNVKGISQSKMTGDQWLGTLSNKPGVKPEELDWTGLKGFLEENKGKPVTKAQIEEHLANNKVELKEVVKGDKSNSDLKKYADDLRAAGVHQDEIDYRLGQIEHQESINTKYHSYQLPGGENYREMLLTLPKKSEEGLKGWDKITSDSQNYKSSHWDEPNILAHVRMNDRWMEGTAKTKPELANEFRTKYGDNFSDKLTPEERKWYEGGHAPDAKKSLHLEEIQSDWHQQGRDKGYASKEKIDLKPLEEAAKEARIARSQAQEDSWKKFSNGKASNYREARDLLPDEAAIIKSEVEKHQMYDKDFIQTTNKAFEAELALDRATQANRAGVPDAPFKKSWHELALKRMIREAAEKGYDKLSWTPGEAQAARYDLSKQIETIKYDPDRKHLVAFDKKGMRVMDEIDTNPKDLPDIVGKEVADKLMKASVQGKETGGTYRVLNNADLKIGGEGMKGFYDQIIPKALEKLGKEHGVKVKQERINKPEIQVSPEKLPNGREIYDVKVDGKLYSSFHTKAEAEAVAAKAEKEKKGTTVHYIDIPKSLKDTAMHKGFPLFSSGIPIPLMPIDHDPFKFKPVEGNPFEEDKKK